jgi:hypothetical protein
MANETALSELTRERLHELVWSTPATKLAKEFGVSDVAIVMRCQKLAVPRPPRGYWAQLEFGKAVKKPELPPLPPSPTEVFTEQAPPPIPSAVGLQTETASLHPLAAQFLAAIKGGKLSYDKQRVHLKERELPEVEIAKTQAARAAGVLHGLLNLVEPRGIQFKRSRSKYDGGCFRKGNDDLHLKIEEELVDRPERPGRRNSYYSSWQQDNKVASGRLTFTLNPDRYGRQTEKRWSESDKMPLGTIVAEMAKEICRHYADLQTKRAAEAVEREKQRIESEIRWKKHQEEEAVRQTEEKRRKHATALESAARNRKDDLLKASEWWRLWKQADDFISACEQRWQNEQPDGLKPEQTSWLAWARETAGTLSPFAAGYPDPATDGAFDPSSIPPGGPYPATREFSLPPTMPKIPAPKVIQQGYGAPSYQAPKPYPFWLKYQRR